MKLDYFTIKRNKRNSKRTDKATRKLKIYKKPSFRGKYVSCSGWFCIEHNIHKCNCWIWKLTHTEKDLK